MPTFRVKTPAGEEYYVDAAANASRAEILGLLQSKLESVEPEPIPEPPTTGELLPPTGSNRSLGELASSALSRGMSQAGISLGTELPGYLGGFFGQDEYAKEQLAKAQEERERLEFVNPAEFSSYEDVQSLGQVPRFLVESGLQQLPNIGTSLLAGTAGAVVGGPAGAAAGAFLGSFAQNAPETLQNLYQETGDVNTTAATLAGGLKAALDSVLPFKLTAPISSAATLKLLERSGMNPSVLRTVGKEIVKDAGIEGLTEGAQQSIDQIAEKIVADNGDLWTSDNFKEVLNSAIVGAASSILPGAYGGARQAMAERRALSEKEAAERPPEPETPPVDETAARAEQVDALNTQIADLQVQIDQAKTNLDQNPRDKRAQYEHAQLNRKLKDFLDQQDKLTLTPEELAAKKAQKGEVQLPDKLEDYTGEDMLNVLGVKHAEAKKVLERLKLQINFKKPMTGQYAEDFIKFLDAVQPDDVGDIARVKDEDARAPLVDDFITRVEQLRDYHPNLTEDAIRTAKVSGIKSNKFGAVYNEILAGRPLNEKNAPAIYADLVAKRDEAVSVGNTEFATFLNNRINKNAFLQEEATTQEQGAVKEPTAGAKKKAAPEAAPPPAPTPAPTLTPTPTVTEAKVTPKKEKVTPAPAVTEKPAPEAPPNDYTRIEQEQSREAALDHLTRTLYETHKDKTVEDFRNRLNKPTFGSRADQFGSYKEEATPELKPREGGAAIPGFHGVQEEPTIAQGGRQYSYGKEAQAFYNSLTAEEQQAVKDKAVALRETEPDVEAIRGPKKETDLSRLVAKSEEDAGKVESIQAELDDIAERAAKLEGKEDAENRKKLEKLDKRAAQLRGMLKNLVQVEAAPEVAEAASVISKPERRRLNQIKSKISTLEKQDATKNAKQIATLKQEALAINAEAVRRTRTAEPVADPQREYNKLYRELRDKELSLEEAETDAAKQKFTDRIDTIQNRLDELKQAHPDLKEPTPFELSVGRKAAAPATPESARAALERAMGRDVEKVTITNTPEEAGLRGVPATAKGAVIDGKAHLFTQNIEAGREFGTFLHEVGVHLGMERLVGKGNYNFLAKKIMEWSEDPPDNLESKIAKAALKRVPKGVPTKDELIAYFVEEAVDNFGVNPSQIKETATPLGIFFRKLLAGIKNILGKFGLGGGLSAQDVIDLAYGAAHLELRNVKPIYYSQLARAIENAKQTAMPAKQWVQWLDANAAKLGVKKDELENSNVKEFLESQDNRKVTKDELAAQVREGGTRVEETIKEQRLFETKYGEYTLPGGKNYREVLLTLPEKKNAPVDNGKSAATMLFERDMMEKYGGATFPSVYNKLNGNEIDKYEMLVREDRNSAKSEAMLQDRRNNYRSSHWREHPNVLAHIRLNDRTDADGNKVLFVEEIQSDWAQEGRRKGFVKETEKIKADLAAAERKIIVATQLNKSETEINAAIAEYEQLLEKFNAIKGEPVPEAPFVTDTEAWTKLAIKRIIRMAAEEGYDKVAFVNGTQSADRYDLSKQVDKIVWNEKTGDLAAQRVEGGDTIKHKNVTKDKLADLIGKDPADRLINAKEISGWRAIEGDDLKVGGEGMKAYYDKIVPQVARKVLKDVGGAGLEEVKLSDGNEQLGFTVTPKMQDMALEGQPMFSLKEASENPLTTLTPRVRGTDEETRATLNNPDLTLEFASNSNEIYDKVMNWTDNQIKKVPRWGGQGVLEGARNFLESTSKPSVKKLFLGLRDMQQLAELAALYSPEKRGGTLEERRQSLEGIIREIDRNVRDSDYALSKKMKALTDFLQKSRELTYKFTPQQMKDFGRIYHNSTLNLIDYADPTNANHPLVKEFKKQDPALQKLHMDLYGKYKAYRDKQIKYLEEEKVLGPAGKLMANLLKREIVPYSPLYRRGDFWLEFENPETKKIDVVAFQTEALRREAMQYLKGKGIESRKFVRIPNVTVEALPPTGEVRKIIGLLKKNNVNEGIINNVYQIYLNLMPNSSIMQNFRPRKGIGGFEEDPLLVFANMAPRMERSLERPELAKKLDSLMGYADGVAGRRPPEPIANIMNSLRARVDFFRNPVDSGTFGQIAARSGQLSYYYFIWGNVSSALVQTMNLPVVAYPMLGGKYGFDRTYSELMDAAKLWWRGGRDDNTSTPNPFTGRIMQDKSIFGDKSKLSKEEYDLYETAVGRVLKPAIGHELDNFRDGKLSDVGTKATQVAYWGGWGFQNTERAVREMTLLATYRMARKGNAELGVKPMNHEDAVEEAIRMTDKVNGAVSSKVGPQVFQKDLGKIIGTFKRIQLAMIYLSYQNFKEAFFDASPEVRKIAKRQFAAINLMAFTFAGLQGLPIYGAASLLSSLIASMFGDDDEPPFDLNRKILTTLGPVFADGPVSVATGADFAGRSPFANLLYRSDEKLLADVGPFLYAVQQAAGPLGGIFQNFNRGAELFQQGNTYRALEAVMPSAAKNVLKGVRIQVDGATNPRGYKLVDDPFALDGLYQTVGLTPHDISQAYNKSKYIAKDVKFAVDRRSDILRRANMARFAGDNEEYSRILREDKPKYNKSSMGRMNPLDGDSFKKSYDQWNTRIKQSLYGFPVPDKYRRAAISEFGDMKD